jgi:hypothetical protein
MTGFDEGLIEQARIDAAQMEWERARRIVVTQTIGIRAALAEMRKVLAAPSFSPAKAEGELRRYVSLVESCCDELDGDNWLKSPQAMALMRQQEATRG